MKHIKLFEAYIAENGYSRTLGFRYSEPTMRFQIDFDFSDKTLFKYDLSEDIEEALNAIDVKYEGVMKHETGYSAIILIFNEKEIDSIIDQLGKYMFAEYQAPIANDTIVVRKAPTNLVVAPQEPLQQSLQQSNEITD